MEYGRMRDDCVRDGPVLAAKTRLRRQLANYDPCYLIDHCMALLAENDSAPLNEFKKPLPWELLLFIKWLITDNHFDQEEKKLPSVHEVQSLFRLLDRCYDAAAIPEDKCGWDFLFRKMSFQQFDFQKPIHRCNIARQSLLFGHLDISHSIRRNFFEITGMEIPSFLDLAFFLIAVTLKPQNKFISKSTFLRLEKYYPPNCIAQFLELTSRDLPSIRDYLIDLEHRYEPRPEHQLFEMSPLIRYPLLKEGENYRPYCNRLLYIAVQHWIYDMLRNYDRQWFGNEFGHLFERYVERVIRHLRLPFLTEKQLNSALGDKHKLVDFIIIDDGSKVFVDAKGVEMNYLGRLSDDPADIQRESSSSIEKGIKQGCSVASRTEEVSEIDGCQLPAKGENYLIIVTYKELYIPNGPTFFDFLGQQAMNRLRIRPGEMDAIPTENMYFMPIEEFEVLAQAVSEKKIGFVECLRKAKMADREFYSRKIRFRQHVEEFGWPDGIPRFLDDEFNATVSRLETLTHS